MSGNKLNFVYHIEYQCKKSCRRYKYWTEDHPSTSPYSPVKYMNTPLLSQAYFTLSGYIIHIIVKPEAFHRFTVPNAAVGPSAFRPTQAVNLSSEYTKQKGWEGLLLCRKPLYFIMAERTGSGWFGLRWIINFCK